jgi:putative flavoprotein involved in K+ transport
MSNPAPRRSSSNPHVDVIVVGAGHAGLAMSRCLSERSIDHVVLERGEVAHSWRHERWDSLRLLTPNWQNNLPGYRYAGSDPDSFMTMPEVVEFIDAYAQYIAAPVHTNTTVTSIRMTDDGYDVATDRGDWRSRAVVIASGAHNIPLVPSVAAALSRSVPALTTKDYRNPDQLDARGVLVVGASATGVQLADEIARSGRSVTLAVGEHVRMPRTYRSRDIQRWLDAVGILDQRYDQVDDIQRARRVPSAQLIGTNRPMLDLNALRNQDVRVVGRLVGVDGHRVQFSGSLRNHCAMADLKLGRLLHAIDDWIDASDMRHEVGPPEQFAPTHVEASPSLGLDLNAENIGTIIWATGFRPDYSWLDSQALDRSGRLRHDGGIATLPGLYALGLNFMRRRKSGFICGAQSDAPELAVHLHSYLRAPHLSTAGETGLRATA